MVLGVLLTFLDKYENKILRRIVVYKLCQIGHNYSTLGLYTGL